MKYIFKVELYFTYGSLTSSSMKMWTVSVFEEHTKYKESGENDREYIDAHLFIPLLSSCSLVPSATLKTLITVPFSDAVAICVFKNI